MGAKDIIDGLMKTPAEAADEPARSGEAVLGLVLLTVIVVLLAIL